MNRYNLPQPPVREDVEIITEPRAALRRLRGSSLLDTCRCPKCDGPMTARHGKNGPYFHCQCPERRAVPQTSKSGPGASDVGVTQPSQECQPTPSQGPKNSIDKFAWVG